MPFPTSSFVRDGRFTDVRALGRGAYGQVYFARHTRLGRAVAVKEALPSSQNFQAMRAKFETEARVHAALQDDNIISVYSLEEDPQTHELYLISEYASGGSLADHLRTAGPLSQPEAIRVTCDILAALATTWAQGIVHCDVKPSNILLMKDQAGQINAAKLGDFGVAYSSISVGGTIKPGETHGGTPMYAAPEQASALNRLDVRTDLYALGITLWEMLTGQDYKPLLASGQPDLRRVRPDVHPALGQIIRRAVQDDPARRFQTPEEMEQAMRAVPPPPTRGAGCGRLAGIVALLLLALLLGAGGMFLVLRSGALAALGIGAAPSAAPTPIPSIVQITVQQASPVPTPAPPGQATPEATSAPAPPTAPPAPASLLVRVQERGRLLCGVNADLPGFGFYDEVRQRWSGFDIDFCRVVAVAIFNDPNRVEFIALGSEERWEAITSGRVDVLFRNTTWTAERDIVLGIDFGPTTFHDGQSLMVRASAGISRLADLAGKRVCVEEATTSEANLRDEFAARAIPIDIQVYTTNDETYAAYDAGECDAVTSDASQLVVRRETLTNPADHVVLGDRISREPLGPAFIQDDSQWRDVVSWAVFATIYAEELRVDQANVTQLYESSTDPRVRRLLGREGELGASLGLDPEFGYNIIRLVGNYADIYDRNLGPETPFALERGPNKVWNLGAGGVLASPPFR